MEKQLLYARHWEIFYHNFYIMSYTKYLSGWQMSIGFLTIMYFD